ncbi:hypothetical protein LCGC14_2550720, partial [marine sediment metagenome]
VCIFLAHSLNTSIISSTVSNDSLPLSNVANLTALSGHDPLPLKQCNPSPPNSIGTRSLQPVHRAGALTTLKLSSNGIFFWIACLPGDCLRLTSAEHTYPSLRNPTAHPRQTFLWSVVLSETRTTEQVPSGPVASVNSLPSQ